MTFGTAITLLIGGFVLSFGGIYLLLDHAVSDAFRDR